MDYQELIRTIPDFPRPGVLFRDITPLLGNRAAFHTVVDEMAAPFRGEGLDAVVAIEARGYFFGAPIAYLLDAAFVPIRKSGKLPWDTIESTYELEYGTETVEMHLDGLRPNQRVLLVDDVLATGGTLGAAIDLVERAGAQVSGVAVFIELAALNGRRRLGDRRFHTLVAL